MRYVLTFCLSLALLPSSASPEVDWASAVDSAAKAVNFRGVVLVQTGGQIVLSKAFSGTTTPESSETRYWIASMSKSVTATVVFRLQEEGSLSIHSTIDTFFPDAPADKRSITVEQLLIHTSGLPDSYIMDGIVDSTEAAKRILALPLTHPPGQKFQYTNAGYSLLAIISQIAGRVPYDQLLRREVFEPAGMASTSLWPNCTGRLPVQPLSQPPQAAALRENWGFKGPDGICSNTTDLAKFMTALISGKILGPESLGEMWLGRTPIKDGLAAAGWFITKSSAGSNVIWTRGADDYGHNAIMQYYSDKNIILIALSSHQDPSGPLLSRILTTRLEDDLHL